MCSRRSVWQAEGHVMMMMIIREKMEKSDARLGACLNRL